MHPGKLFAKREASIENLSIQIVVAFVKSYLDIQEAIEFPYTSASVHDTLPLTSKGRISRYV